jgi:Response regulators consisting of a CheY-like receiver domain and a winged-helix DNA-binding domain
MLARVEGTSLDYRILIVEDDQDDVFLLRRALLRECARIGRGIEVLTASNGLDALAALEDEDEPGGLPDVIVLDLNMPVMDGLTFLSVLRNRVLAPDVPTIVVTTSHEDAVHRAAKDAGADAVHVKPDTPGGFAGIVSAIIRSCG